MFDPLAALPRAPRFRNRKLGLQRLKSLYENSKFVPSVSEEAAKKANSCLRG
jgi:hypothetical protein